MTVAHRLRTLAAAVTALAAPLLLAPAALADTATPEHPAGPASHAIDNIYRAVIGTTMVIFILVGGWLVYSAIRFRARPGPARSTRRRCTARAGSSGAGRSSRC